MTNAMDDHDSGVARMYNTNLSVLRPTPVASESARGILRESNLTCSPAVVRRGGLTECAPEESRLRCDVFAGKRLNA